METATEPARHDTANQDLIITGPDLVLLLDGAGGPSEDGGGCIHGVPWYVRQLGSRLLNGLLTTPEPIAEVLAGAIDQVAAGHRASCDLRNPGTPSSTVVVARRRENLIEYLSLHDSTIVLTGPDGCRTVSDRRVQEIPELRGLWHDMSQVPVGSDDHAAARRAYIAAELGYRNTPGGYWVAGADLASAAEAITGAAPIPVLRSVSLFSDGAADLVDAYRLSTWPGVVDILDKTGPAHLIQLVRAAERRDPLGRQWPRFKIHDDASVAHWTLGSAPSSAPWST
ncbi:hypothetical protein GCM10010502_70480 [Kitasatospora aureofaciens]|nr:hypothetical protein GCM10010502_70480 [Kitasatospora aureofaciens]